VLDLLAGHHLLLTATLRALGCHVYAIECSGRCPAMLDEQLASNGPFDVVLWDLSGGMSSHPWTPVLAGGRAELFGRSGLVIAASEGQDVPRGFHPPGAQTLMLRKPFTPMTLMDAVNAAVSCSREARIRIAAPLPEASDVWDGAR
jgi:hypothetical protein